MPRSVEEDDVDFAAWGELLDCLLPFFDGRVFEVCLKIRDHCKLTSNELESLPVLHVDPKLIIKMWFWTHSSSWR